MTLLITFAVLALIIGFFAAVWIAGAVILFGAILSVPATFWRIISKKY